MDPAEVAGTGIGGQHCGSDPGACLTIEYRSIWILWISRLLSGGMSDQDVGLSDG